MEAKLESELKKIDRKINLIKNKQIMLFNKKIELEKERDNYLIVIFTVIISLIVIYFIIKGLVFKSELSVINAIFILIIGIVISAMPYLYKSFKIVKISKRIDSLKVDKYLKVRNIIENRIQNIKRV